MAKESHGGLGVGGWGGGWSSLTLPDSVLGRNASLYFTLHYSYTLLESKGLSCLAVSENVNEFSIIDNFLLK